MVELDSAVEVLKELSEDTAVPKNIRTKIINAIELLGEPREVSVRINKALDELETAVDDPNLQSYSRTQIWQIISMLESV